MSREKREPEYPAELESQFILRLPEEPATALREVLQTGENLKNRLTIQLEDDMRHGEVRFDHWLMNAKIVDLPTITESLKTIDNKSFYKTADVSQMMICKTEPDQSQSEEESPAKIKKKDPYKVDKKYLWPHGITPPTKNVRKRRFRKTLKKKSVESPEIEKEVKRLLRADNEASSITWEVITEDEVLQQEVVTPIHTPKSERKKRSRSSKKEPATCTITSAVKTSNVVDIFGGAVSDSDAEEGNNVEVEVTHLFPEEFVVPSCSMATNEVKEDSEPKSEKKHRSKKNKDKKKNKKKKMDKDNDEDDKNDDDNHDGGNHDSGNHDGDKHDGDNHKGDNDGNDNSDVYDTIAVTESEHVVEDVCEFEEVDPAKDSMTLRIQQVGAELELLKARKSKMQQELSDMKNDSLKNRFKSVLHSLIQDVMYKEMEYQGLITLQNSDEI